MALNIQQVPRGYSPQQNAVLDQLLSMGAQGLQGNKFDFAPIEQQARADFESKTIPSIAERFTAMGGGAQNSGAFQGALGSAGAGLERSLASLRGQYGLQQQGNLLNMLQMGLQPRFEAVHEQQEPGFLGQLGSTAAYLLPHIIAALATGGASEAGSATAAGLPALISLISQLFGKKQGGSLGSAPAQGSYEQMAMLQNLGLLRK